MTFNRGSMDSPRQLGRHWGGVAIVYGTPVSSSRLMRLVTMMMMNVTKTMTVDIVMDQSSGVGTLAKVVANMTDC